MTNLRKQYANYQDADVVEDETIFKTQFTLLDEKGTEVDTGSAFIGKEDIDEFPILKTIFYGKKEAEELQIDYIHEDLPPMLQNRNTESDAEVKTLRATVSDIKKVELPELTPENIQKFFGNDEITTIEALKAKISEAISGQKRETLLMQGIEGYLQKIGASFEGIIPKTLIDEEVKSRNKSLIERFGSEEGLQKYYEKIGEEEKGKMDEEIKGAAKSSLEKFFLLRKVIEMLGLELKDEDWQTPLAIENALYDKLSA